MNQSNAPLLHFHMVQAEVIFQTGRKQITSHRTQFITQSPVNKFPADRLQQLQNSAAASVRNQLPTDQHGSYKVLEVLFHNFLYCGEMTNAEFYGPGKTTQQVPGTEDTTPGVERVDMTANQEEFVADGETEKADTVVPMKRKDD